MTSGFFLSFSQKKSSVRTASCSLSCSGPFFARGGFGAGASWAKATAAHSAARGARRRRVMRGPELEAGGGAVGDAGRRGGRRGRVMRGPELEAGRVPIVYAVSRAGTPGRPAGGGRGRPGRGRPTGG